MNEATAENGVLTHRRCPVCGRWVDGLDRPHVREGGRWMDRLGVWRGGAKVYCEGDPWADEETR